MLLHDYLKNRRVILASNSPRRRELMSQADIPFILAEPFEADECYPESMPISEIAQFVSLHKSHSYPYTLKEGEILITADTIVVIGNQVLGKPSNRQDAIRMIEKISGISHQVITGITLRTPDKTCSFEAVSKVWMRKLELSEIEYYVDRYNPTDKAGGYGIQEWIGCVAIERIEGSFYNVMGLPVHRLYKELQRI